MMPVVAQDICATMFEDLHLNGTDMPPRSVLNLCQRLGLLPGDLNGPACPHCGTKMYLGVYTRAADGYSWRCGGSYLNSSKKRVKCKSCVSLRTGTIFGGSHLTLATVLLIINY